MRLIPFIVGSVMCGVLPAIAFWFGAALVDQATETGEDWVSNVAANMRIISMILSLAFLIALAFAGARLMVSGWW